EQNQDPKAMDNLGKALIIRENNKSYQEEQSLGMEQDQHKKFKSVWGDLSIKLVRRKEFMEYSWLETLTQYLVSNLLMTQRCLDEPPRAKLNKPVKCFIHFWQPL
ncbi:hypothetical protein KI387_034555, partial [Taxus chinensis]